MQNGTAEQLDVDEPQSEESLDTNQYSVNNILKYEKIFGVAFMSNGGRETTEKFLNDLDLKPNSHVLDVGCGIGGSAFIMDVKHGAVVRGVDLSRNMLALAKQRREEVGSKHTTFHLEDITKAVYPDAEFDLIYSRDAIMHLDDKQTIYTKFLTWLKPGGRVFVTDYSCHQENQTQEFMDYLKLRHYKLISPQQYRQVLENAGFEDIEVKDLKAEFLDILHREVARTEAIREEYVAEFSQKDYDEIVDGWKDKIRRVNEGTQMWIFVTGRKPRN